MASRRLAISSLLCDGEDGSNRPESQDNHCISPAPAVTHQPVALRPYASPIRSAFNATESPILLSNTRYEAQYRREAYERSPTPPSPVPYALSRSTTPPPPALQPVVLNRRTPSPPPMSLPASPETSSATGYDRNSLEDKTSSIQYRDSRDFQSHNGLVQRADPIQSSAYSHYEPPFPPPSPVDINRHAQQSRRAALQMPSYDYSRPLSQIPNSPSAEPSLSHAHFPSVSPRATTTSPSHSVDSFQTRQVASRNEYEHQHRSPSYPQQISFPAYRSSASVSPTNSKNTGQSGLDVLVQAATEERERIDESRRLSGGGGSLYSPETSRLSMDDRESTQRQSRGGEGQPYISAVAHQETNSPATLRNNVRLQPTSPKNSPRSAPVVPSSYGSAFPTSPVALQHLVESPPKVVKRTRLSPEISPAYGEVCSTDNVHQTLLPAHVKPDSKVQMRSVADPEKTNDTRVDSMSQSARQPQRSQVEATGGQNLEPDLSARLLSGTSPSHSSYKTEIHLSEDANRAASSSRIPSGIKPPAIRNTIPVGRRSPPRSRPKPKKPGSVALASLELISQESVPLKPMDIDRTSVAKPASSSSQVSASKPRRVPSSKAVVTSARKKIEDEDSTDFFLSAISSPKEPQEVKLPASDSASPKVQAKQRPSLNNNPRIKQSRKSALAIDTRRSPASEILDQIISPSPDDLGNGHAEYENKGYHSANYLDDIDDELANAVATTTDGDEGYPVVNELEEPDTDAMEVDVENELLSLLEDQAEVTPRPADQATLLTQIVKHAMPSSLSTLLDRPSMPPPDVINAASSVTKPGKRDSVKSKGKAKARTDAAKLSKQVPAAGDETAEKVSKPKTSKPRPPKGSTMDKMKQAKTVKDLHSPAPTTHRGSSIDPGGGGTPVDESFPVVTSSGRMVTKSKKVAAAAAAANSIHSLTHSKKKTPVTSTTQQEGNNEARSRSHSVMPRASVDPESQREKSARAEETKVKAAEETEADDDDKLYCICKTKYDEDRVMIACDRCDDWYHTQCIDMPDLDIDLVDQFICPLCIERNPNLQLQTTYKQRCFSGLNHPKPKSADACHKPSRGAFSKYCSDECGVKFMHRKAQAWASKGGDIQSLWATVKDAKRREGVVTAEPHRIVPRSILAALQNSSVTSSTKELVKGTKLEPAFEPAPKRDENANAAMIKTLQTQLDSISKQRESWKKEMDLIIWRERLLILAAERASRLKECGWDQRLCFGDEEVMEFGDGVLESYDESVLTTKNEEETRMDVDEQVGEGEWWCRGKQKCERHAGWQKLRISENKGEKEMKEAALVKLTSREREIRGRIEDILHPQTSIMNPASAPKLAFKVVNGRKGSDDGPKKGKKKNSSAL